MSKENVNEQTGEIVKAGEPIVDIVKYDPKNPVSLYMNGSVFHQVGLVARTMAQSMLVPEHLRDKPADCFLIVAQAVRWGMDPFAVAQSCYVARGKVGYEGKLIAALINARLGKTLNYEYFGEERSKGRGVRVFGTLKGEGTAREIKGTIEKWATGNDQWKTMPDQMLAYRGAREWARRHMPEAVLGIYSIDEVQDIERQDAKADIGDVVDGILGGDVRTEDDPPEETRSSVKAPDPGGAGGGAGGGASVAVRRARRTRRRKVFKPGDVMPDGRIVDEVDDEGQPTIYRRAKPPKSEPKPVAEAAVDVLSMTEDEIEALFQ